MTKTPTSAGDEGDRDAGHHRAVQVLHRGRAPRRRRAGRPCAASASVSAMLRVTRRQGRATSRIRPADGGAGRGRPSRSRAVRARPSIRPSSGPRTRRPPARRASAEHDREPPAEPVAAGRALAAARGDQQVRGVAGRGQVGRSRRCSSSAGRRRRRPRRRARRAAIPRAGRVTKAPISGADADVDGGEGEDRGGGMERVRRCRCAARASGTRRR